MSTLHIAGWRPGDELRLNAGAEEQRVVFRIPRDAAGNVAQPDMTLNDILSAGTCIRSAFVNDMEAGKKRRDVLAGGIFCAAGHPMVAVFGQAMKSHFRHKPVSTAARTTGADGVAANAVCQSCGCASVMSHEHLEAQRLLCEHPNRVQLTRFKDCGKCVADVFAPGQVAYARREVPERGGRRRGGRRRPVGTPRRPSARRASLRMPNDECTVLPSTRWAATPVLAVTRMFLLGGGVGAGGTRGSGVVGTGSPRLRARSRAASTRAASAAAVAYAALAAACSMRPWGVS